jgi:hypothetical protein
MLFKVQFNYLRGRYKLEKFFKLKTALEAKGGKYEKYK